MFIVMIYMRKIDPINIICMNFGNLAVYGALTQTSFRRANWHLTASHVTIYISHIKAL